MFSFHANLMKKKKCIPTASLTLFIFRIRSQTGVRSTTTSQKPFDKLRWFSNIQQKVGKSATCRRLRHPIHRTTYLVLTAAENSARVWQIGTYLSAKTFYPTKRTQQRRNECFIRVCWCKFVPLPICRLFNAWTSVLIVR